MLRYKRHYFTASGIHAESVAAEFLQHANEEQGHGDLIAQRIVQLGGEPNFDPEGLLTRSHAEYDDSAQTNRDDQGGLGCGTYSDRQLPRDDQYVGNDDTTTRRMLEGILAMEEEHADDLVNLLQEMGIQSAGKETVRSDTAHLRCKYQAGSLWSVML